MSRSQQASNCDQSRAKRGAASWKSMSFLHAGHCASPSGPKQNGAHKERMHGDPTLDSDLQGWRFCCSMKVYFAALSSALSENPNAYCSIGILF